jgi:hypothetical protein
MGFRDLRFFNRALLALQSWRLLIFSPNSLCSRILKAKYFPNRNLLEQSSQAMLSILRRAIEYGIELLKKSTIWRVGKGTNIQT